jgi:hypothetical protein
MAVEVTVTLHGPLRYRDGSASAPMCVALPDGATAGDLLAALAERLGEPFAGALEVGSALPTTLRLFVGGELVALRHQPLESPGSARRDVHVVVTSPVSGG